MSWTGRVVDTILGREDVTTLVCQWISNPDSSLAVLQNSFIEKIRKLCHRKNATSCCSFSLLCNFTILTFLILKRPVLCQFYVAQMLSDSYKICNINHKTKKQIKQIKQKKKGKQITQMLSDSYKI